MALDFELPPAASVYKKLNELKLERDAKIKEIRSLYTIEIRRYNSLIKEIRSIYTIEIRRYNSLLKLAIANESTITDEECAEAIWKEAEGDQ